MIQQAARRISGFDADGSLRGEVFKPYQGPINRRLSVEVYQGPAKLGLQVRRIQTEPVSSE